MISLCVQLLRDIQYTVEGNKLSSATDTPSNLERKLEGIENQLCYVITIMKRYQNECTLPDSIKKGPPFNWSFDDTASSPSMSPNWMEEEEEEEEEEEWRDFDSLKNAGSLCIGALMSAMVVGGRHVCYLGHEEKEEEEEEEEEERGGGRAKIDS